MILSHIEIEILNYIPPENRIMDFQSFSDIIAGSFDFTPSIMGIIYSKLNRVDRWLLTPENPLEGRISPDEVVDIVEYVCKTGRRDLLPNFGLNLYTRNLCLMKAISLRNPDVAVFFVDGEVNMLSALTSSLILRFFDVALSILNKYISGIFSSAVIGQVIYTLFDLSNRSLIDTVTIGKFIAVIIGKIIFLSDEAKYMLVILSIRINRTDFLKRIKSSPYPFENGFSVSFGYSFEKEAIRSGNLNIVKFLTENGAPITDCIYEAINISRKRDSQCDSKSSNEFSQFSFGMANTIDPNRSAILRYIVSRKEDWEKLISYIIDWGLNETVFENLGIIHQVGFTGFDVALKVCFESKLPHALSIADYILDTFRLELVKIDLSEVLIGCIKNKRWDQFKKLSMLQSNRETDLKRKRE